jgi:hypothetical protein
VPSLARFDHADLPLASLATGNPPTQHKIVAVVNRSAAGATWLWILIEITALALLANRRNPFVVCAEETASKRDPLSPNRGGRRERATALSATACVFPRVTDVAPEPRLPFIIRNAGHCADRLSVLVERPHRAASFAIAERASFARLNASV